MGAQPALEPPCACISRSTKETPQRLNRLLPTSWAILLRSHWNFPSFKSSRGLRGPPLSLEVLSQTTIWFVTSHRQRQRQQQVDALRTTSRTSGLQSPRRMKVRGSGELSTSHRLDSQRTFPSGPSRLPLSLSLFTGWSRLTFMAPRLSGIQPPVR